MLLALRRQHWNAPTASRSSLLVTSLPWRRCFASVCAAPRRSVRLSRYASFLRTCGRLKILGKAREAHDFFISQGVERSAVLENLLLYVYGECGSLDELECLFSKMRRLDILSWNFTIKAQSVQGNHVDALQLFTHMLHQGFLPSKHVYISLFTGLNQRPALKAGTNIHACACIGQFSMDIAVNTALIIMYGNCGEVELARKAFDMVSLHDAISWTAMIVVYTQHAKGDDALSLFNEMLLKGLSPDSFTFVSALDACADIEALSHGKKLHFLIVIDGFKIDLILGTTLVHMYGKCGSLEDAERLFSNMNDRNILSWNAMIGSTVQHKHIENAFQLFEQTLQEGILPNKITFISMLDACTGHTSSAVGRQTHARISGTTCEHDLVVQTALIEFYGSCGKFSSACNIFANMIDHDDVSFISIVSACAISAAFIEGKQLHSYITCNESGSNLALGTALINMYSKCGSILDAHNVFDRMKKRNIISWNAIIGAYCQNGFGKQVLSLYGCMLADKVKPDAVTFLSVLSACSHTGLLKEGCCCFLSMKPVYGIVPNTDHYNCLIDLLGRTGRLVEAEELLQNMPWEPCVTSWTTLLSACRKEVDVMRAERIASRLVHLDHEDAVPHVMLANTYAAAGRVDEAEGVLARMKRRS